MKRGRAVTFHGAYSTKADAKRKEHRVAHGYIRPTTIRGHRRFLVLSRNPARAEHRPRVTIGRRTGRTFTLGRHSPWKGRVRRVNPRHRARSGGGSGLLWLGLIAGGLWLLSRRNAEAVIPVVETLPGTIIQGPSGPETATTTPDGSGPGVIYG